MKKNILYLGIAVIIGLLGGYLIFGNSSDSSNQKITDAHDHSEASTNEMWTCSMHPQIMQPEQGDCPICGMDLIPAETSTEGLAANQIKMTENAMALANIETTIIGNRIEGNNDGVISLSGKIAANEENNAIQASYFDGRLEKLNVSFEGQEVIRGQLLATIYSPNLVAAQQELITASSLKESQPALYKAVRNKLKLWKLSASQIDNIELTRKVRENFPLYATVSGTVEMVMAAEGNYLKQGQPILKVSNLNSVWAEFDAYENQISQFKKGLKIKITTSAHPNKVFDAVISFIDPVLNSSTRTVTVRATLKNNESLFKPGMFISGKIKGSAQAPGESLNIPASAVLWTGKRSLVYVKSNPNEAIFEMREVTVGLRNGDNFTVTSGLENGEEIVTNGTFTVDAAAQLQGKKSMMNKSGGKTMTGHERHTGIQSMGDEIESSHNMDLPADEAGMKLPETFQKEFQSVLKPYLKMKDAFVVSDALLITSLAKEARNSFKSISTKSLGKMEKSHADKSIEMLNAIANNQDLENQRAHFVILNENLMAIAMNLESSNSKLYVQECPMANSSKGAKWLSVEKEIKNPYYGDAMLTCGSVVDSIH